MQVISHKNGRIDILDAIRGIAILAMVFYHGMYDICDIFGYKIILFDYLTVLEPPFAGAFILLAGVSSRFSHSNIKRGLKVVVLALALSAITIMFDVFKLMPGQSIYFGILHFMGFAILLFEAVRRLTDRIPTKIALPLWIVLFIITYNIPTMHLIGIPGLLSVNLPAFLINTPHLFALGFPDGSFYSADYFPMIPWFFLFLAGTIVGIPIKEHRLPEKFYTARVPFLASAGRNTLIIYVLHQPLIYGILYIVFNILKV